MKTSSRSRSRATRAEPRADGGRAYRGLSPEARKAERRERLVAAGLEVFGTVGFRDATVRQLCAAAGLTERYFYESFDNQTGLFVATYDHAVDGLRTALMQAVVAAPPGFAAMAESVLRAFYGELQREPRAARIMLIEIYGPALDRGRLYQRGVLDFAALVRALIDAKVRVDQVGLDSHLLATAVVGACIHLATHWLIGGFREPLDTMVANSLAIVMAIGRQLRPAAST